MVLEQHITHTPGTEAADIMLYALSTCGWCRKTKGLLDELGVEYSYVYVDQLSGDAQREALDRVRSWNPNTTFPTMVLGSRAIIGHREDDVREALGRGHS
jgi:glutaredoxin